MVVSEPRDPGGPGDPGDSQLRPTTWVLLATVGLAFKGIFAGLAFDEGASVLAVMSLRVLLALPLFWLGARLLLRRAVPQPKQAEAEAPSPVSWRMRLGAMACGVLYCAGALADFRAIQAIGAGPSRVLLFSYPAFILIFDAVRERRMPPREQLFALAIAWPGLALVALGEGAGAGTGGPSEALLGAGLGLFAALTYALYLRASQDATRTMGSPRFAAWSNTGTALAMVVGLAVLAGVPATAPHVTAVASTPPAAAGWILTMAVLSTVVPFFLLFEGIRLAGATRASLITLAGPPVTLFAAWLALGETLRPAQLLGAAMVLCAVGVLRRRPAEPAQPPRPLLPSAAHDRR
ncbi:hypothetical protein PPSIR1_13530 [Plesiocystis pacifica SIR-1]|uniref:EamA domain-containing protein n=1 Tax=Plesiocystis pacifica SIR-1 TaxID=391625 RepID=A6GF06_9BACT|nr:hypothetical protein PPSIR1_13530 [Plesiocystis pacifica SIR-1]